MLKGGSPGHVEQTIDDPGRWKRFYPDVEDRIPPDKRKSNELEMLRGESLGHVGPTIDDPGQWKRFYPDVEDRIPPDKGNQMNWKK